MANKEQWVNLAKDRKYEDKDANFDRLGPITMVLEFEKKKPPKPWKVRVTPEGSDNVKYSRKELGRNQRFKLLNYVSFGLADDANVLLENTVRLPAAGGNKYKIEAKDADGKTVGSPLVVETRRRLFYQVISMKGIAPVPTANMEKEFWSPAKKYYLKLDAPKPAGEMKFYKNIKSEWEGTAGRRDMFRESKKAYKLKDLHPYTFVLVCNNQVAKNADVKFKYPFKLWGKLFSRKDEVLEIPVPGNKALWFDFDDIDDAKRGGKGTWLRHRVVFDDGKSTPVRLDWANVELGPKTGKWYKKIKVTIPKDLRHKVKARKGHLVLQVKVVKGFSGGYSDPMANFITVCQYAWHKKIDDTARMQTVLHEVGHKVGMVPDGKGIAPNAPPNLYGEIRTGPRANNRGHQGPHCGKGATWNATKQEWSGRPLCIMFGSNASSTHDRKPEFCSDCEEALRKMDIDSRYLGNFKYFVSDY